jgi:hypothetical protein
MTIACLLTNTVRATCALADLAAAGVVIERSIASRAHRYSTVTDLARFRG